MRDIQLRLAPPIPRTINRRFLVRKIAVFAFAAALVLAVTLVAVHADNETMPAVGQAAPTFTLPRRPALMFRWRVSAASGWFSTSIPRT